MIVQPCLCGLRARGWGAMHSAAQGCNVHGSAEMDVQFAGAGYESVREFTGASSRGELRVHGVSSITGAMIGCAVHTYTTQVRERAHGCKAGFWCGFMGATSGRALHGCELTGAMIGYAVHGCGFTGEKVHMCSSRMRDRVHGCSDRMPPPPPHTHRYNDRMCRSGLQ